METEKKNFLGEGRGGGSLLDHWAFMHGFKKGKIQDKTWLRKMRDWKSIWDCKRVMRPENRLKLRFFYFCFFFFFFFLKELPPISSK